MEFWGVEVKAGKPVKVNPEEGAVLHISQASLGESKGKDNVVINVKVDGQKFVLGTLSHDKFPQLSFDLLFEKEFELSHNWKNGSVYFVGYHSVVPEDDDEFPYGYDSDSDEEAPELIPAAAANGKPEKKGDQGDAKAKAAKPVENDDSDEDDESEDSDDDDSDSDEEMADGESDEESDDEEDDDDEEEETPKKVEGSKKRLAESATKTPDTKKAKATPEKTDGKKGGYTGTPHPAKQAGKTPGNKHQAQTPKSNGQSSGTPSKKQFSSGGKQSYKKAKNSGK